MTLEKVNGRVLFRIRQYKKSGEKLVMNNQKEVCLNKQQARDLMEVIPGLKKAFLINIGEAGADYSPLFDDDGMVDDDEGCSSTDQELREHIGSNVYARVQAGMRFVDIRRFYFKAGVEGPLPSPQGVTLNKDEFQIFASQIQELNEIWRGLAGLGPCYQNHFNEASLMKCEHCTPPHPDAANE